MMTERFKVLYVDDEPELLDLGRLYLEKGGVFSVDILTSPHEAFPSLSNSQYDAIISDYQMPGMNGIEFLQKVRSSGNTIPFILFTGRGREEVVIDAINHGADFYLQKGGPPQAQFAELAHKVRQAVLRKRAERSLQESERRYRDVVETQTEFIARFKPDGTHVFVNEAYCRQYGVTKDEIIGHRFFPPLPKEDQERVRRHFASFTPDHRVADIEHQVIMPDGSVHWHWWNDHAIFDNKGTIIEFQSVGKDITDRKRSEEEIRATYEQLAAAQEQLKAQFQELRYSQQVIEERGMIFRTIFENSPYPIAINSLPDGHFISVNKAFLQSSGYTEAEILGKSPNEVGLLSVAECGKLAMRMSVSGKIENLPIVLKGMGGARIHAQISTIPVTINNKPALLTMTAEITKLKRIEEELLKKTEDLDAANTCLKIAEEEIRNKYQELQRQEGALRNSEEKFRALFENSLDGIMITDLSGNLLFTNQAAGRIVDIPDDETFTGKINILDFIAPESQEVVSGDLCKVSKRNGTFFVKYKLVTGNRREVWVDCIAKNITFEGSDAMLISMRDITEQQRGEETMKAQCLELQHNQQVLLEREATFRAILSQSYGFIGLMTTDGTLVDNNRSSLPFEGIPDEDIQDRPFWEAPWWKGSPMVQDMLKDAITRAARGETTRFETVFHHADGQPGYIDLSIKPVVDETGKIMYLVPEGRDITELRRPEEELK